MKSIDVEHLSHMEDLGFKVSVNSGVYWFAHKGAQEGFNIRGVDDDIVITDFAFINGEQVEHEACTDTVIEAIQYMEDVYGISPIPDSQQQLGPFATVAAEAEPPETKIKQDKTNTQPAKINTNTDIITEEDFKNKINTRSTLLMMQKTMKSYVKTRKGPKGTTVTYVDVNYMTRSLNFAFGFDWSFAVTETRQEGDYITVLGSLDVNMDGVRIKKEQWGSQQLRSGMELGDGLKAATSDALKKCASMFGIAADVYAGEFNV